MQSREAKRWNSEKLGAMEDGERISGGEKRMLGKRHY